MGHTTEAPWDRTALAPALAGKQVFTTVAGGDESLRVLTHLGPPGIIVQAAYPLTDVRRVLAGLDRALLLLIPVALLGAGAGGALLHSAYCARCRP